MKHLNDIDKIFKDALEGRREVVPSEIWKAVDEHINKKNDALRTVRDRFKNLVRLLIVLIFSSAIFYAYHFYIKEGSTTKQTAASDIWLHTDSAKKDLPYDKPSPQLSKNNLTLPVGDGASNRLSHFSTDTLTTTVPLTQNNKINSNGSHHRINYPTDTSFSNDMNTLGQGYLHHGSPDYLDASPERKIKPASLKVDKQSHRILTNQFPTEPGKTAAYISKLVSNKRNRSMIWEPDSSGKAVRTVIALQSDVLPEDKNVASISNRSIQPWPFDFRFNGIELPAINSRDLFSHNNLLKKEPIKLHSMHNISIEPFGSVNYSFRNMDDGKHQSGRGIDKDDVKKSEERGGSFSAGVLINYGISKGFFIQSGLVFSSLETNINAGKIYARGDNNGRTNYELICSSGYSYLSDRPGISLNPGDSIAINASRSTIKYISLPLTINYIWQHGKFILKPGVGLSANILTYSSSSISVGNSLSQYTEKTTIIGMNHVYLDGLFALGVEYKLTHKLSIGIRPLVRLGITAINNDTPVKTFQNYLNLEAGLKIKL